MTEAATPVPMQAPRKRRSDRLARRLTATAGAAAFGLAGILVGLAAGAPRGAAPALIVEPPPSADQALAKAVADYEAAVAARNAPVVVPAPPKLTSAPAPARAKPTARPPAVVSGGS